MEEERGPIGFHQRPVRPATTAPIPASTGVRIEGFAVAVSRSSSRARSTARGAASGSVAGTSCDNWPYLDEAVLWASRSRKVCMTCHWFRHQASVSCIPLLTCQLHQGLISHGEHLTHRCSGWTEDLHRQQGWAPEVA
jgi:hypothetical protein